MRRGAGLNLLWRVPYNRCNDPLYGRAGRGYLAVPWQVAHWATGGAAVPRLPRQIALMTGRSLIPAQRAPLSVAGAPRAGGAPPPSAEGDWLADARRYLIAIQRYRWMVFGLSALGLLVGFAFAGVVLAPGYAARASLWIHGPAGQEGEPGPLWSGRLPISAGWSDLVRTNIVLDDVVRGERLYLTNNPASDTVLATFAINQQVRPGRYRLVVDNGGTAFTLRDAAGRVLDRGAVGDSVGARLGFVWVPSPGTLHAGETVAFTLITPSAAAAWLTRELKVSPDPDGNFIQLELYGPDASRTTAIVNAVAARVVAVAADLKRANLTQLNAVLGGQMRRAEADLRSAEGALQRFRMQAATQLADGTGSVTANFSAPTDPRFARLLDVKSRRTQLLRDREAINRILARSSGSGPVIDALATIGAVAGSTELSRALGDLTQKQAMLRTLQVRYTAESPLVRRLTGEVATLEQATIPELAAGLARELERQAAELERQANATARDLRRIPPLAVEQAALQRAVTSKEQVVADLRRKYDKVRLAVTSSIPDLELVDPAVEPQEPSDNWAPVIVMFCAITCFGAGACGAILLDRTDRRVHDPDDVAHKMGLKVLGVLPHFDSPPPPLWAARSEGGVKLIEAMRGIHVNVLHSHGVGPAIMTVTSPGRADGKSFVAAYLATAFADAGYRTLLIDGDVRCGVLHRAVKLLRRPGLTDLLGGEAIEAQVVQRTRQGGLWFIGCGTRTRAAPTLVGSGALPRALARLRPNYDAIIIDSSPLAAGADALALGTAAGSLLLVLRTGVSDGALARVKLYDIRRLPIRVLGAVVNGVRLRRGSSQDAYYLEGYEAKDEPESVGGPVVGASG